MGRSELNSFLPCAAYHFACSACRYNGNQRNHRILCKYAVQWKTHIAGFMMDVGWHGGATGKNMLVVK